MNIEQERAELLPCPFCGEGKDLIVQHCEGTIIHPAYRIYCGNCGASNGYSDRVDPVKNWNSRAALQSQDRADALRYRWLCDKFGITKLPCAIERIIAGDVYVADGKAGIDEAIDHARRVEENK